MKSLDANQPQTGKWLRVERSELTV